MPWRQAIYPAPILAATVAGGLVLCERLRAGVGQTPPRTLWWLLVSAHAGRLALFLDASVWAYLDGALLVAALTQHLHMGHGRPNGPATLVRPSSEL